MREQLSVIGSKIKKIRKDRKMTLQTLAERTGLTAGLLSKIENFRTIPSLPILVNIAVALQIDLPALFEGMTIGKEAEWLLIRSSDHRPVEREEERNLAYEMILETPISAANMQLLFVTIPPGPLCNKISTEADELLYIQSGSLSYWVGNDRIELTAGDCLFFNGALLHAPENNSGQIATLLAFYFLREAGNAFVTLN